MKLLPLIASVKLIIAYSRGWFICAFASIFERCKVLIVVPYNDIGILLLVIISFCAGSLLSDKFQKDRAHTESPESEISAPAPPPPFYPTFDADTGRPAPPTSMSVNDIIEHNDSFTARGSPRQSKGSFALPPPLTTASSGEHARPAKRPYHRTTPEEQHTIMVLAMDGKGPSAIANSFGLNRTTVARWVRAQKKKGLLTQGASASAGASPASPRKNNGQ